MSDNEADSSSVQSLPVRASHPSKPKVTPPRAVVGTPIKPPDPVIESDYSKSFREMIERTLKTGSPLLVSTITFMQEYVVKMAPDQRNNGIPAADYQLSFFRILKSLIDKSAPEDFTKNWNVILAFFWNYKNGALGERYVNRFSEYWARGDLNLAYYQRLINLCLVSSDPNERANVTRIVNVSKTVESGYTPTGVQNILQFYHV